MTRRLLGCRCGLRAGDIRGEVVVGRMAGDVRVERQPGQESAVSP